MVMYIAGTGELWYVLGIILLVVVYGWALN